MKPLNEMLIIFSMYSRIPLPQPKWNEEGGGLALCFFPLIGTVIGAALLLWYQAADWLGLNDILFAAIAAALPVLITGGIHMDGFCDTVDGLSSYASRERKLEILKDPNAGAFAIIHAILYFLLYFSGFTRVRGEGLLLCALSYPLSRSFCIIKMLTEPSARPEGMAGSFIAKTNKKAALATATGFILLITILLFWVSPGYASGILVISLLFYFSFRRQARREFGGITGDLLGYFIVKTELYILITIILLESAGKLWNL